MWNVLRRLGIGFALGTVFLLSTICQAEDSPASDPCGFDRPQGVWSLATSLVEGADVASFPVSTQDPVVQSFVDQGVAQLLTYQNAEAERSFRQAARLDHRCSMAYWGIAMSRLPDEVEALDALLFALETARHPAVTSRETAYLHFLKNYLDAGPEHDQARRQKAVEDLERLLIENPDDQTARVLLARQLRLNRDAGLPVGSPLAIDALLRLVLADEPRHPCELERLRLWAEIEPAYVLDIASESPSMPSSMPAWHVRGHVFERLGRYEEAGWRYEAAARVALARAGNQGLIPDQIAGFAHNRECQARCLATSGHVKEAIAMAREMIALPRHPLWNMPGTTDGSALRGRRLLAELFTRYEMWDDLLALADSDAFGPSSDPREQALRLHLMGRASFALGNPDKGRQALAELQRGKESPVKDDSESPTLAVAIEELQALDLLASGSTDEALARLRKIEGIEPVRLASLLFQGGQAEEAENVLMQEEESHPADPLVKAALVDLRWKLDRSQDAEQSLRELVEISAGLDLDVPPFSRLAPIILAFGLPEDWRTHLSRPVNSASRPPLETLGPASWEPVEAPGWTLVDSQNAEHALSQYRGKPVVLIFYLGAGCLHCVEQIQSFAAKAETFQAHGLPVVCISTEDRQTLKTHLDTYGGAGFPFTLLANPELDVFREAGAFEALHGMPLHGTFLIDANGRVLVSDIGPEPFNQPDFVLDEARRLGLTPPPVPRQAALSPHAPENTR